MSFREIVEGDVNYAKMHTQANPKYASGTKWRKSSAAVKAKADDVGAGDLGAHGGGSGHVSVKATRNQHDKLATRQEINAGGHKTFAIKQTRLPRTSIRKPLPEGLEDMSGEFRELVEAQLDELSRGKLSLYIGAAKADEKKDRSTGVKLAQKKKWGDVKYGFEEPKVKATNEGSSITDLLTAHAKSLGKKITTQAGKEIKPEHRQGDKPTIPAQSGSDDKGYGKGRYMGDDVNISAVAVNESKIKDPGMQRISRELLESVLIEQPAALIESSQDANKWLATANHALNNADGSTGLEHHKWMAVHHKAMAIHAHKTGNSDAEQLHDKMSERHSDHVPLHDNEDHPDEHFHNGVSHHWNRF